MSRDERIRRNTGRGKPWATVLVLCLTAFVVRAELVDVHLKSGVVLRGEVTRSEGELILNNDAGQTHIPLSDVLRVVPVAPTAPATQPTAAATRPAVPAEEAAGPAASDAEGGPPREEPEQAPADEDEALPPAPWVSDRDILHLRLGELTLDGPPEPLRVRFKRKAGQEELPELVLEALRQRTDFRPEWAEVLEHGRPEEQLQLIVRLTGLKHADRIELNGDPQAFQLFRRHVLPLVRRSCARSGCHGGRNAHLFRFPVGSSRTDRYAYTAFVLLDQMQTRRGPLIERIDPPESILVKYMLPRENNPQAHPPEGRGPSFRPAVRSTRDEEYRAVVDWINFLLVPRPDYQLEYENPYRGPFEMEAEPPDAATELAPPDGDPPS